MIGKGEGRCRHGLILVLPLAASSRFARWLSPRIEVWIDRLSADAAFLTRFASSAIPLQR